MDVSANLLRPLPLFEGVSEEGLERIAALARREGAKAQQVILEEGTPATDVHVLLDGRVALSLHVPGAEDLQLTTLTRGELLGWSALLDERNWVASAVALKDTEFVILPGVSLRRLCAQDHEVGYVIMRNAFTSLATRLQDTRIQCLDMFAARE